MEPQPAAAPRRVGAWTRAGLALELVLFVWGWWWLSAVAARIAGFSADGAVHGLDYLRWALLATPLWSALVAAALFARGRRRASIGAERPREGGVRACVRGLVWGAVLVPVAWGIAALAERAGLSLDERTFAIGSTASWLGWLAGGLLAGALGEELIYRGYLLERVERLLEDRMPATWATRAAVLCTALAFGATHAWQGSAAVVSVSAMGLGLGWVFLRSGRNLVAPVVAHGVLDAAALTALHLSA
jgi:membrane protease YdiL (CAAX protease family)